MCFRLVKLSRYYVASLNQHYAAQPDLASRSYEEQHAALMAACLDTSDFYSRAFKALGYETLEIVANAEPLQKQWAQEHGYEFDDARWWVEIAVAQIRAFKPDVVYVSGGASILKESDVHHLRATCPSIRLMVVVDNAPAFTHEATFRAYDFVISNTPEIVKYWKERGLTIYTVPIGFAPEILDRIDTTAQPRVDFGFIGSIMRLKHYHLTREALLAELLQKIDLEIWSDVRRVAWHTISHQRARQAVYDVMHGFLHAGIPRPVLSAVPIAGRAISWKQRPSMPNYVDQRIARRAHAPVYGLAMYQLLHDTRITLNIHLDFSANSASNMRLYEATGVRSCLLTDWKDDLPQKYEPEQEVVTYRSVDEAVEKARFLLEHEDERARIAAAGQARTLRDHTVANRVAQIDALINEHM